MNTIKPEIRKLRDMRGIRIKGYLAKFGDIEAEQSTEQGAVDLLHSRMLAACNWDNGQPTIIAKSGYVGIVLHDVYGWQYRLVFPDGHIAHCSCTGDRKRTIEDVTNHMEQLIADSITVSA